jgi:1-acyl-sn-glycerol-3-phosphate acyltransferase
VINIFCRKIVIINKQLLSSKGPLLLAVNHPNSFLDAVILGTLFDEPIYSLARGDVFNNKWITKILRALKILPVYREREGKEHLHRNYHTFDACLEIFKKNGTVLIFTEALSENEWHLRPLKKGTARLAVTAWEKNIPVNILPVGINYSSYKLFGKNIHLHLGEPITAVQLKNKTNESGRLLNEITDSIEIQLKKMVYEINKADKKKQAEIFYIPVPLVKKIILTVPAVLGLLTHYFLYWPVKKLTGKGLSEDGHFDSIVTGLLFILYPFYLLVWIMAGIYFTGNWYWVFVIICFPFFAWSYVQLKTQIDP